MKRWISLILYSLVAVLAADAALARANHMESPPLVTIRGSIVMINWGGATSRGDMRVSGLPAVMRTRSKKYRRVLLQQGSAKSHTEPGERVNRPEFGSGKAAKTGRLAARRHHKPIRIRKRVDPATPFIRRAHSTRRVLPRVVLKGRDTSDQLQTIVLMNVMITSHSTTEAKGGGDVAMEELTLSCEDIYLE